MKSVSCGKINEKFRGDADAPLWGFFQKSAPVFRVDSVIATPLPRALFGHAKIGSKFCSTPRLNNFSKTLHNGDYGASPQTLQENVTLIQHRH